MEEDRYLKIQKIYKIIMLIAITSFITFLLTTVYISNKYDLRQGKKISLPSLVSNESSEDKLEKSIKYIEGIVKQYYLNEIDEQKAIEGAISGYVSSLGDEYTEYIPEKEMKEYTEQITGTYVGIGIYMVKNKEKNTVDVLAPIKESPAEEAGLLPGDSIIKVDGKQYTGDETTAAANAIKGEEGTKVNLEILRGEENLKFEITRKKITTNPVVAEVLEKDIGYIEVSSFDEETANDFKNKFEGLKEKGIKSLIIDLRNNGGGIVEEALEIADYVLPKDTDVLITVDKNDKEEIRKTKSDPIIDMPIIILVNENTASASEILAGALKDYNKAKIVGKKTYGKGVIQQVLTLNTGAGLKITVEEYFTPKRTKIHKVGIEPDETIELPETVKNPLLVKREEDTQLKKAMELLNK